MIQVHISCQLDDDENDDIDPWDYIDAKSIDDLEDQLIRDVDPPPCEIRIDAGDLQSLWDAIVAARAKDDAS